MPTAYLIENDLNTYAEVATTVQAFINDPETILTLIANGQFKGSLADLREMESVLIDIDSSKEALIPRSDPTEETSGLATEILERTETELLSEYRGTTHAGLASALGDVEPAPAVTVDEPDSDGADSGVGTGSGTETFPADGRGSEAGADEDAPIADADGGIEMDVPSWAEEETAGSPEQGGGGSGFVKP